MQRMMFAAAGLMGAAGIAAAAWAQHGLANTGNADHVKFALIASRFAVVHAVALLAIAAALRAGIGKGMRACLGVSGGCFFAGFVLFCGGLWLLAAGGPSAWAHAIPIGGTLFIVGWLAVFAAALAPRPAH